MNPTGIEWCTIKDQTGRVIKPGYSWNPVCGCGARCGATVADPEGWCYARKVAKNRTGQMCDQFPTKQQVEEHGLEPGESLCGQFWPHLHPLRLPQPTTRQEPRGVFVGSMGDMWDPHVVPWWRGKVLDAIYDTPQHTY